MCTNASNDYVGIARTSENPSQPDRAGVALRAFGAVRGVRVTERADATPRTITSASPEPPNTHRSPTGRSCASRVRSESSSKPTADMELARGHRCANNRIDITQRMHDTRQLRRQINRVLDRRLAAVERLEPRQQTRYADAAAVRLLLRTHTKPAAPIAKNAPGEGTIAT